MPRVPLCPARADAESPMPGNALFEIISCGMPFSGSCWLVVVLEEEVIATHLLLLIQLRVELVDTRSEIGRITTEGDIEILQELVDRKSVV